MVTGINRNWFSGLSSGLDTQGLIDKLIQAERVPIDRIEQRRSTLQMQKDMLQEINLKLFGLQNKATDLLFTKTFSSKLVTSTDDKLVTATANSDAKIGNYLIQIKQLATNTKAYSKPSPAGPLEYGTHLRTNKTVGGENIALDKLGVTIIGNIEVDVAGLSTEILTISVGLTSTVEQTITDINGQISSNSVLNGKIKATYDNRTDQIKFTLLDTSRNMDIDDLGGGNIVSKLFGAAPFTLSASNPMRPSSVTIRSGEETTLNDLRVTDATGKINVQRGAGPINPLTISLGLGSTTIADAIDVLNNQLDAAYTWKNPDERLMEFRYDEPSRRMILINTDSSDTTALNLTDGIGVDFVDFVDKVFGASPPPATLDPGLALSAETFGTNLTAGTFTIDGTAVSFNLGETLQTLLTRITTTTTVNAKYDSSTDTISFTRKDGLNQAIGLGSASDTSNFLSVAGLLNGSQETAAFKESQNVVNVVNPNDLLNGEFGAIVAGPMRVTVDGVVNIFTYDPATETVNGVLNRMRREITGIEDAYYDGNTDKVMIRTTNRGTDATLKIEDISGNLAQLLELDTASTATGTATGATLETTRGVSTLNPTKSLATAGFQTIVTSGSFTINGTTFNISSTSSTTLQSVLDSISNNVNAGVNAEFESSTGRIVLTAKAGGNTSITFGHPNDTSNFLEATGLELGYVDVGQNAVFKIDGIQGGVDIIKQSNTINDVIDNVTFNLRGVTDTNGETIDISANSELSRTTVDDFITAYNEITQLIYDKLTEQHDYEMDALTEAQKSALGADDALLYESAYKIGLLNGDSTLSSVRSRMRVITAGIVSGLESTIKSLSDIGITTGVIGSGYKDTQVGLLKITDEDKLNSALNDNPDLIFQMFANDGTTDANKGLARRLKEQLNEFTKSGGLLTSRVGRSGLSFSNSEFDKQIAILDEQISRGEIRLKAREENLIKQFAGLESSLSRYQSQSSAFSSQLAQLTGG